MSAAQQTALVNEMIEGQKVVQAFGHEAREPCTTLTRLTSRLQRREPEGHLLQLSMTNPATRFVNNLVYAGVGLVGALYGAGRRHHRSAS